MLLSKDKASRRAVGAEKDFNDFLGEMFRTSAEDGLRAGVLQDVQELLEDAERLCRVALGDNISPEVVARVAGLIADREKARVEELRQVRQTGGSNVKG